jgi:PAP2 superfamily
VGVENRGTRPHPVRELLLVAALFLAYKLGALVAAGDLLTAYANASHVWSLERALGLPSEAALQRTILGDDWLVRAANVYYARVHFPATGVLLLWTYLRRPDLYRWARTIIGMLTAAGFAIQVLIPLAPPRLFGATGMIDTGHALGPSAYSDPGTDSVSNQYAAMPSLHVGWAATVAIVLIVAIRSRWRWLWLLHPLITLAVVIVTGNHYWLDVAVALVLLAATLLLVPVRRSAPVGAPIRTAPRSAALATPPSPAVSYLTDSALQARSAPSLAAAGPADRRPAGG